MTGEAAPESWTILRVLDWTRDWFQKKGIESARLDAEVLLAHALGVQRVMLYARYDQPLKKEELEKIRALVSRRAKGEPVAYVVGEREFWSLPFIVSPAVLIPRPDTEVLVEVALEHLKGVEAPYVCDVGTGSGCIAVALAKELPASRLVAIDRSPAALEVARANAQRHVPGDRIELLEGDLLEGLGDRGPFHAIVANLPYVPEGDHTALMKDVRDHEPHDALFGGPDGLELVRRLVARAGRHLVPGGALILEGGHDQLGKMAAILSEAGFEAPSVRRDYAGHERVVAARWPRG